MLSYVSVKVKPILNERLLELHLLLLHSQGGILWSQVAVESVLRRIFNHHWGRYLVWLLVLLLEHH